MTTELDRAFNPLPEAPASATVKVVDESGFEFLLTTRAHTMKEVLGNIKVLREYLLETGWAPANGYRQQSAPSQAQPAQIADGQPVMSFPAEKMVKSTHKGKTYWKVQGGRFSQFGVTIWPEVLESAGFNVEELDKEDERPLSGLMAWYTINEDGKPAKVIKLAQPQPVAA